MARNFDGTDTMTASSAPVAALPLTQVCWFKPTSATTQGTHVTLGRTGSQWPIVRLGMSSSGKITAAHFNNSGSGTTTSSSVSATTNVWQHAAAVFNTNASRSVFLNGSNKVSSTTSVAGSTTLDKTTIGAWGNSNNLHRMNGDLAEIAIWNVALTDNEITWLATGASPLGLTHRLANLVLYQDCIRDMNRPYIGPSLSNSGTTVTRHPKVWHPFSRMPLVSIRIPGPYKTEQGQCTTSGSKTGELFQAGTQLGQAA